MDQRDINKKASCSFNVSYKKSIYERMSREESKVNSSTDKLKSLSFKTNLNKTKTIYRSSSKLNKIDINTGKAGNMEIKQLNSSYSVKAAKTNKEEITSDTNIHNFRKTAKTRNASKSNTSTIRQKIYFFETCNNNTKKEVTEERQSENDQQQSRNVKKTSGSFCSKTQDFTKSKQNNIKVGITKVDNMSSWSKLEQRSKPELKKNIAKTNKGDNVSSYSKTARFTESEDKEIKVEKSKGDNVPLYSNTEKFSDMKRRNIEVETNNVDNKMQFTQLDRKRNKVENNQADNISSYSKMLWFDKTEKKNKVKIGYNRKGSKVLEFSDLFQTNTKQKTPNADNTKDSQGERNQDFETQTMEGYKTEISKAEGIISDETYNGNLPKVSSKFKGNKVWELINLLEGNRKQRNSDDDYLKVIPNDNVKYPKKVACCTSEHSTDIEELRNNYQEEIDQKLEAIKLEGCEEEFEMFDQMLLDNTDSQGETNQDFETQTMEGYNTEISKADANISDETYNGNSPKGNRKQRNSDDDCLKVIPNDNAKSFSKVACSTSEHSTDIEELRNNYQEEIDQKLEAIKLEGCEEEFEMFDQMLLDNTALWSDGKHKFSDHWQIPDTKNNDELNHVQMDEHSGSESSCALLIKCGNENTDGSDEWEADDWETDESENNDESNGNEINKNESNINDDLHSGNLNSMQHILKEIIITEHLYIINLDYLIKEYIPLIKKYSPEDVDDLFGNLVDIYEMQLEFLDHLETCSNNADKIIEVFLKWENLFRLYPVFFKTNSNTETITRKLQPILEEKQRLLHDKFSLSSHLIKPLQRLGKYGLFIENIIKQFTMEQKDTKRANEAIKMMKGIMALGNTLVTISSFLNSPIKPEDYGSLLLTDKFALLKPKRMELVVFLFTKIIIFTTECSRTPNKFEYWNSIKMTDVTIKKSDLTSLQLADYTNKSIYKLNVKNSGEKEKWENEIKKILWEQFTKEKQIKQDIYEDGMITIQLKWEGNEISIQYCPSKFKNHGALLMMNDFKVTRTARRPEKITVFIFDEIILLTKLGNTLSYHYIDCIKISSINLLPKSEDDNNNTLSFNDSVTSKNVQHIFGDLTYKLEAHSEAVKNQCENILSQCLIKSKENEQNRWCNM